MITGSKRNRAAAGGVPSVWVVMMAASLLSACAPVVVAPSAVPEAARQRGGAASPAARELGMAVGQPSRAWWRALQDPTLDELVAAADARNPGAQAAAQAVAAARALLDLAERESLPQGRLNAEAQALRPSAADADPFDTGAGRPPERRLVTLMQGVSWEIDLFGRTGTAAGVAARELDSAQAQAHAVRAALHGDVVRHYVSLRWQQQVLRSLQIAQQAASMRAQLLQARHQAGLQDRREWLAALAESAGLEAERSDAQRRAQLHRDALAVLAGQSPRAPSEALQRLAASGPLPAVPDAGATPLPADLLSRRPDVALADARLRARMGEAVLADRAHLPRLSLNLGVGLSAPASQWDRASALRYGVGPVLWLDWLDAGRHRARAAAARAGEAVAWRQFEETVLQALQDGESALRSWAAARDALAQAQAAERWSDEALTHAQARVEAGLEPRGAAVDQSLAAEKARRHLLATRAEALLAYAQVQLALGAWQPEL
jgi:outer membrane protein TolC